MRAGGRSNSLEDRVVGQFGNSNPVRPEPVEGRDRSWFDTLTMNGSN